MNNTDITYSLDEANYILKNLDLPKGKLTLFDWILILFKADQENPIVGINRLMNEIFLMYNQIISEYQILDILFREDVSGVSSDQVENAIDDLLFVNYLGIIQYPNPYPRESFRIADRGIKYIAEMYDRLEPSVREALERSRMVWNSLEMSSLTELVHKQFNREYSSIKIRNSDAWRDKGDKYLFELGEYDKAVVYFNRALEINPEASLAWKHKGEALQRLEKHEEALFCFDRAISLLSASLSSSSLNVSTHEQLSIAFFHKGEILFNLRRLDEAKASFEESLKNAMRAGIPHFAIKVQIMLDKTEEASNKNHA